MLSVIRPELEAGDRIEHLHGYPTGYDTAFFLQDIFGTGPLQLESVTYYLRDIPFPRRWELLAVRVLTSQYEELPVPASKLQQASAGADTFNIWKLDDPRGFAHLVYAAWVVNSRDEARGLAADQSFDLRHTVLLETDPGPLNNTPPEEPGSASIQTFEPERIEIDVNAPQNAILTLSLPYYPGWQAKIDGREVPLLRAYGSLSALYVPAGDHDVEVVYHSRWLEIGAGITAVTLAILFLFALSALRERPARD